MESQRDMVQASVNRETVSAASHGCYANRRGPTPREQVARTILGLPFEPTLESRLWRIRCAMRNAQVAERAHGDARPWLRLMAAQAQVALAEEDRRARDKAGG